MSYEIDRPVSKCSWGGEGGGNVAMTDLCVCIGVCACVYSAASACCFHSFFTLTITLHYVIQSLYIVCVECVCSILSSFANFSPCTYMVCVFVCGVCTICACVHIAWYTGDTCIS